ncbi:MAG: hypothetical protein U0893_02795 [Chloroflexota bacterium]
MSHEQGWILEDMARMIQADRLAAAEKHRLLSAAVPDSNTSPRIVLAKALRSLAALLDREPEAAPKTGRRLVRAY